jgi:hypothetical protein
MQQNPQLKFEKNTPPDEIPAAIRESIITMQNSVRRTDAGLLLQFRELIQPAPQPVQEFRALAPVYNFDIDQKNQPRSAIAPQSATQTSPVADFEAYRQHQNAGIVSAEVSAYVARPETVASAPAIEQPNFLKEESPEDFTDIRNKINAIYAEEMGYRDVA